MKSFAFVLAALLAYNSLFAQACHPVDIANTAQKKMILRDYIKECKQKHFFFGNKGAIKLVAYQDTDGTDRWLLSAIVDDHYRELVPEQYSFFSKDIVLVYKADKNGNLLPIPGDTTARAACIRKALGSRVSKHLTKKEFVDVRDENGRTKKIPVNSIAGGNPDNSKIIRFNKDGTVSKMIPV